MMRIQYAVTALLVGVLMGGGQVAMAQRVGEELPERCFHRPRIAVVNFEVPPGLTCCGCEQIGELAATRLSGVLSDMFISALVNSGSFDVIERSELDNILREQHLNQEGLLNPRTAPRYGRILGVDYILGGKLTEFGVKKHRDGGVVGAVSGFLGINTEKSIAQVTIDARIIETNTARIILATTGSAENCEGSFRITGGNWSRFIASISSHNQEWIESRFGRATRCAICQITKCILERFPMEAVVVSVLSSSEVVLDRGTLAGVKIGDQFVLTRVTQIHNPNTDEIVYENRLVIGTVRVTNVQENGCKAMLVSGQVCSGGIQVNDVAIPECAMTCRRR